MKRFSKYKRSKEEEAELHRLIREQYQDMRSSHTVIKYKRRNKNYQPNYKSGDDKEIAIELENHTLRTQNGKGLSK